MQIKYTMLRPDLDVFYTAECDNFKSETHPITGKFTLHLQTNFNGSVLNTIFISGVVMFQVLR